MPSTPSNSNKSRPLEAWEGANPNEGVRTRHRSERLGYLPSQSRSQSSEEVASAKQTKLQCVQQELSKEGYSTGLILTDPSQDKKSTRDVGIGGPVSEPSVPSKRESQLAEHTVTTCDQNVSTMSPTVCPSQVSTSKSTVDNDLQIHKDGDGRQPQTSSVALNGQKLSSISGSPKQTTTRSSQRQYFDNHLALESDLPAQIPALQTKSSFHINNIDDNNKIHNFFDDFLDTDLEGNLNLRSNPFNSDMEEEKGSDIASDITLSSGQETIDQLKAKNEDLRSENKYFRLMSEIAMKGYLRTPLAPSSLSLQLTRLHQKLLSEGLKLPNSASDRGRVLTNVVKLHLSREAEKLKYSISPAAAANSFVEFAGLFIPQIQDLAIAEFAGGEDTEAVRVDIITVVLQLVCWIVEQCAMLAESFSPHYITYEAVGWWDDKVRFLWILDECLEAACKQKILSFPEAKTPGTHTEARGMYSPRIMNWASTQLTWANNMAGRLQGKVGKVPNRYDVLVELFGLTRQTLETHIRRGQR